MVTFLLMVAGFTAMTAAGVARGETPGDGPLLVRTVHDWGDVIATELLSAGMLVETGKLFDVDLLGYLPMFETGMYRIVVLAEKGMPIESQAVGIFRAEAGGAGPWVLDRAFRKGYGAISTKGIVKETSWSLQTRPSQQKYLEMLGEIMTSQKRPGLPAPATGTMALPEDHGGTCQCLACSPVETRPLRMLPAPTLDFTREEDVLHEILPVHEVP
jgi:hypothetical protein